MSDSVSSSVPASRSGLDASQNKAPVVVILFLILVIMVPIEFHLQLGTLTLTPAKIYLLFLAVAVVPKLFTVQLHLFDWFFIAHVGWTCVAYMLIYPLGRSIEMSGMYGLEFLIVYMMARLYLQRVEQIRTVIGLIFVLVAVSGALALPEALTGIRYVHDLATEITGNTYRFDSEIRMGIYRAHSFFEHPILYGIFCASSFSLVWFMSTPGQRLYRAPIIIFATWLGASSAPILTLLVQILLLVFERMTRKIKRRDKIFGGIVAAFVLIIENTTGRGVVGIVTMMTLNPGTAYYRRSQWVHAIDDVMRNPWFGFIPYTYTRPFWLAPSIDNWWLLMMMRSGIPSLILLALSALFMWMAIVRRDGPPLFTQLRTAWGLTMVALILGAATVTFFGKLQPLFAFYMGMGAALATCYLPSKDESPLSPIGRAAVRYTRFGKGSQIPNPTARARRSLSQIRAEAGKNDG